MAPPTALRQRLTSYRIMIAEDDHELRSVMATMLRANSCHVIEADNGKAALALALENPPHIILSDYGMPELNGYELLSALRMHDQTRSVPVVMLTGSHKRLDLEMMGLEIQAVLKKPFSQGQLLGVIADVLGIQPQGAFLPSSKPIKLEFTPFFPGGPTPPVPEEARPLEASTEALVADASTISLVDRILGRSIEMKASDIHFEPQEGAVLVRVRVDGMLRPLESIPKEGHARMVARLKIMSNLVITQTRIPQDGRFGFKHGNLSIDFRVSTMPSQFGEKVVLRLLGTGMIGSSLADLGFSTRDAACIDMALRSRQGLILASGPTGSGKTTTLYAMLKAINTPDINIMTVEDPIEYRLPGITQIQVNPAIGLSFGSVLRSVLRQDPDVIMVGEIRDEETAEIAIKAALTGHLVFSSIHTNSAPATLLRLFQMGVPSYLIASAVRLVFAQRLLRRLCPGCRTAAAVGEAQRAHLTDEEAASLHAMRQRGGGCERCGQIGYLGRASIFEVMPVRSPQFRQAISQSADLDVLTGFAAREGMADLHKAALTEVAAGNVSLSDALGIILSM
jgi:type II secretory ATPase GspE/PulE/Tfp pilus assembly ATPase PilB-like protein